MKKSYNLGNKFAEKYTEKITLELFDKVLSVLETDKDIHTEGYLKVRCTDELSLPISSYEYLLNKKFKNVLSDHKKRIDTILEHRVIHTKKMYPGIAAMTLKNKHGWKDSQEIDQNVNLTAMGRIFKDGKEHKVEIG